MKHRRRNVQLHFFVTPEEQALIYQRVDDSRAGNFSNYARKMLLEGEIRWVDVSALRDVNRVLGSINRDLHQIVYRAALINDLHEQDYRDILADYEKIREAVNRKLMRELNLLIQQNRPPKRRDKHGCDKTAGAQSAGGQPDEIHLQPGENGAP